MVEIIRIALCIFNNFWYILRGVEPVAKPKPNQLLKRAGLGKSRIFLRELVIVLSDDDIHESRPDNIIWHFKEI